MISSVSLRNWKAYDKLDIDLAAGTTFLVARNGVGKTSYIEAVLWGLLGSEASRLNGDAARRGDHDAMVRIQLHLPKRGPVTLTRTAIARSGRFLPRETVSFAHGAGHGEGEAAWNAVLTEEWKASPSLLGRLLVLPEHAVWQELSSPAGADINAAIRNLLRLDALRDLGAAAQTEFRKAEKRAQESKAVSTLELQDAQVALETAHTGHASAEAEVQGLRAAYLARGVQRTYATTRAEWDVEHAERLQQQSQAREAISALLDDVLPAARNASTTVARATTTHATTDDVPPLVQVTQALDDLDSELASARALRELNERHRQDLTPDHDCPVCLRPMDSATVQAATQRHADLERDLVDRIERLEQSRQRLATARDQVTVLHQRLTAAPPPEPTPPEPTPDKPTVMATGASADLSDEELLAAGQAAAAREEQLRDALGVARSTLITLNDADLARTRALAAFRRQALSRLVKGTSERLTDALTAEAAHPLLQLIREQWKKLPLGDALDIDDECRISVVRNGRRLNYECLSGGEKAQVVLLYRVAALKALSEAPILLLDEPLEHLDPRNRWRFGRMLASLSGSGALTQTLVTTYEEPLARRLAYQAERSQQLGVVSLRYLTNS